MQVKCPKCEAVCNVDDSKIPDKGIYGNCPKCKERFFVRKEDGFQEATPESEKMECPHCHHKRNEGDPKCLHCGIIFEKYERKQQTEEDEEPEETKKCPFCGEEILAVAKKCKHCREDLTKKPETVANSTSSENIGYVNAHAPSSSKKVGILLAIGIFFMPAIFAWFTLRKGHTTKAKAVSFLWLGFLVVTIMGAQDRTKSNNTSSPIASPTKAKVEQIMIVNLNDILSAYKNNEVGADNKYKGKIIQVTGKIDDIKKDIINNLYVTLGTGAKFEIPQIQAFFDDSMNNELGRLNKGEYLTIVGKVQGLMMNVLVKDCIIK